MTSLPSTFMIRKMVNKDKRFLLQTWLLGLRNGCTWFKRIDEESYMVTYSRIIEELLKRGEVLVACLSDDEDTIIGFSCRRGEVLDYVYVRKSWRRMGIANALTETKVVEVSHMTDLGFKYLPYGWKFNPFSF